MTDYFQLAAQQARDAFQPMGAPRQNHPCAKCLKLAQYVDRSNDGDCVLYECGHCGERMFIQRRFSPGDPIGPGGAQP